MAAVAQVLDGLSAEVKAILAQATAWPAAQEAVSLSCIGRRRLCRFNGARTGGSRAGWDGRGGRRCQKPKVEPCPLRSRLLFLSRK